MAEEHGPEQLVANFVAAFNSGNAEALDDAYVPDAVLVPAPGYPATGDDRRAAGAFLMSLGIPMKAQLRHGYVAGDIALLIVDWSIHGTAPDGQDVHLDGTAADVARRGADGVWRNVIDNPYGTGTPAAAG